MPLLALVSSSQSSAAEEGPQCTRRNDASAAQTAPPAEEQLVVRAAWGKLEAPRRAREVETGRTGRGRGKNGELGGKKKKTTKRKNPRERKIKMPSKAITSKRFKKSQECPTEISFTLLSKLKYSAHVQVSHFSDSGEPPQPEPAELLGNMAELLHGHLQLQ